MQGNMGGGHSAILCNEEEGDTDPISEKSSDDLVVISVMNV